MILTYFDMHAGRGEAARLAMAIGDVAFEDNRLPFGKFRELREELPYYRIPTLEVDGALVTQSSAIDRYVGKLAGLYPEDPWQAALCDEVLGAIEDCAVAAIATFSIEDDDEKKAARAKLVEFPLSVYLKSLDASLRARGGEYFADGRLTIADLKAFVWTRSLGKGTLDYVPTDVVEKYAPTLAKHRQKIADRTDVKGYYATF